MAALITLVAVRASGRPADSRHPYGHGKVENLSALVETALLLLTCVWIVYEAVRRLFFAEVEVEPSVVGVRRHGDLDRGGRLPLAGAATGGRRSTGSQALEADALHFSTDVWSSSVVIVGPRPGLAGAAS